MRLIGELSCVFLCDQRGFDYCPEIPVGSVTIISICFDVDCCSLLSS